MSSRETGPLTAVLGRLSGVRCLVTGHNGFVGSWLCQLLLLAGAEVTGLSLEPVPGSLGAALSGASEVSSRVGDVRDGAAVRAAIADSRAELVVHLAAQALVLPSYDDPLGTFATNVMGTAHVLDAVRQAPHVEACLVVTSDKCYALGDGAHVETDPLGGDDPYSASKAAAEHVAHAYRRSFAPAGGALATTRAGNIVGGGDRAPDRIVADWARALHAGAPLRLRRPSAIRPWQHVLDAAAGYARLLAALLDDGPAVAEAWNFGPPASAAATVGEFVALLDAACRRRGLAPAEPLPAAEPGPPERAVLLLDSTKAVRRLGWSPVLDLPATADWIVEWEEAASRGAGVDALAATGTQIERYLALEASAFATTGREALR